MCQYDSRAALIKPGVDSDHNGSPPPEREGAVHGRFNGGRQAPFTSPVFEAALDDLAEFFSADSSRAVDKQSLLLERTVNQR